MFLRKLNLLHFRNYAQQELSFDARINIIRGNNGQGKTNLLEAIYYLAVSRSFRTNHDQELIHWDSSGFFLKGSFQKGEDFYTVESAYQGYGKKFKIKVNGAEVKRSDFIYQFPVVVFSPDDLLLIKEGPAGRRRFLNLEASRLKSSYYRKLKDYQKVLQQRNRLLKENSSSFCKRDLFEPWDRALVSLGSTIIRQRISLLKNLEEQAQLFFEQLAGFKEKLSLNYVSSVNLADSPENIEELFWDQLNRARGEELQRGYTLIGPHLDDFLILINNYEAKKYASQGQQRTAVLALKMGEVNLFFQARRESPIVLLDDVFSEFDQERRFQLLNFLRQREGQSFITTAVPFDTQGLKEGEFEIFSAHKGKINREGAWGNPGKSAPTEKNVATVQPEFDH